MTRPTRSLLLLPRLSMLGVVLALSHFGLLIFFAVTRPDIGPPPTTDTAAPPGAIVFDPYNSSSAVVAGRLYHFAHEPVLLQFVSVLDLPANLLCLPLESLARRAGVNRYALSWVDGISWLAVGTLQWLWVGSYITARRRRTRAPSSPGDTTAA